ICDLTFGDACALHFSHTNDRHCCIWFYLTYNHAGFARPYLQSDMYFCLRHEMPYFFCTPKITATSWLTWQASRESTTR
ncbi:MAG: hypothetical protein RSA21_09500, partial [Akkermansia sp.]